MKLKTVVKVSFARKLSVYTLNSILFLSSPAQNSENEKGFKVGKMFTNFFFFQFWRPNFKTPQRLNMHSFSLQNLLII